MAVRKRGERWYFDVVVRGERFRGVIPEARTGRQAERAEKVLMNDLFERRFGQAECTVKFSKFVETHYRPWIETHKRSAQSDRSFLKALESFFGDMPSGKH
jgi:hypothetical protein